MISYVKFKNYLGLVVFFKDLFMYLLKRQNFRERERQGGNFHPVVQSANCWNSQGWGSLELGARCFFRLCHIGVGAHAFGPSSAAF